MQQTMTDIWVFRDQAWSGIDLTGFDVESTDGKIGSVSDASREVSSSFIVVDTGPWIFGHKALLPAGTISSVDTLDRKVFVNLTKDQIKNAPEFDESKKLDENYRRDLGDYYGRETYTGTYGQGTRS
ncbi:MAG TPA: hypothetical protein VGJ46_00380 [Candidatus Limnocylindrales bacterium]|jgi:hypothetical protein